MIHDPEDNIQNVVSGWIEKRQKNLDALLKQRTALDEEIERVRQSLADVMPFAETLGIPFPSEELTEKVPRARRVTRVPARRSEYAGMKLLDAAKKILATSPTDRLHADDIVEKLFVVTSPVQFTGGKSSLVPTLSAAVSAGELRRVAPNTFQLVETKEEPVAVNDKAPP